MKRLPLLRRSLALALGLLLLAAVIVLKHFGL